MPGCNFCEVLLRTHCEESGGEVCKIYEEYRAGEISGDEALERFYAIVPDEQLIRLDPLVRQRLHQDPGKAAAEKWLHNYRYGKDG